MAADFVKYRGTFQPALAAAGGHAPDRRPADWQTRWIVAFLAVGVAVRLIRYLLRFPLWGDEAMLAMNFLDRDYVGLMRPLDNHQVAPLLFLWTELTAVRLLGFNEWALRLFPFACGIISIFLFHRLANLLLRGMALVLAVGIFAVSYSCIRYAAEMKPYGVDLMVSTIILMLTARWWRQPDDTRWLWTLTAIIPLALGLSFPAIFVAGGASLAIGAVLLHTRGGRGWIAWGAYNFVLTAGFLAWYWLAIRPQAQAELSVMTALWSDAFPPRGSLLKLAAWLLQVHAGSLLALPIGGDHWGSAGTLILCLIAVGVLIKMARYRLLLLCAGPFGLNLLAAAMGQFPYGGHMRLAMHFAPIACILAGIGLAATLKWIGRIATKAGPAQWRRDSRGEGLSWPAAVAVGLLFLLAALSTARDFHMPGKDQQEIRKRDFAAWFWGSMEREHEVVCIATDLKRTFPPQGAAWQCCVSPQFLCNERIYSPRHARQKPFDLARVKRQRSLACVQYWSHDTPYDGAAFGRWLDGMKATYDFVAKVSYPLLQDNDTDRAPEPPDRVEVYQFVPKRW